MVRTWWCVCLAGMVLLLTDCTVDQTVHVGIQPFDNFDRSLADTVSNALSSTFGVKTHVLTSRPIPEEAFVNLKTPRYRADDIIRIMREWKSDTLDYIVSLTNKDISTTKKDSVGRVKEPVNKYTDWGIYGLGYQPGSSCVVSSFRMGKVTNDIFISRLKKISIHEFGHNLGLSHCESELCVMRDAAETIKTIDYVHSTLCDQCKKKLDL